MPNYILAATLPLDGFRHDFNGLSIFEVTGRSIVSIATPLGGEPNLNKILAKTYKTNLPKVGQSLMSSLDNAVFMGMAQDQFLVLFDHCDDKPLEVVSKHLNDSAYLTDQSDSYVMLRVSGLNSRLVLERICPIDLAPTAFPEGSVARTIMEHLGAVIVHEKKDTFLLMSARSSAKSFLEAVETSAVNVC
ncbi:sarcosine oxidase subunit gamma [Kiloniella antarctica]|uniref:Sarcosine oxidase subunit gamma n=1 Tax=Kiloniella antarctica TaxID=1550907 RepID=A0ABW5BQ35_9PROT